MARPPTDDSASKPWLELKWWELLKEIPRRAPPAIIEVVTKTPPAIIEGAKELVTKTPPAIIWTAKQFWNNLWRNWNDADRQQARNAAMMMNAAAAREEEEVHEEVHELKEEEKKARSIEAYKKALAKGSFGVAYSRVLFLGTAGVGMRSFKNSLMELPWKPNTSSTVVSDIFQVRPFTNEWHTLKGDKWGAVSYGDEINELVSLIWAVYQDEIKGFDATPSASSFQPEIEDEVNKILSDVIFCIKGCVRPEKPRPFFHFWDSGGQLPFLEILPVFLTSRTLFFLIFDAEKDLESNWKNIEGKKIDQEEVPMTTLDYMLNWMANIHGHLMSYDDEGGFCAFPRMYCIGTHGDRVKDRKSKIKKELKQQYQSKDYGALIEDTVIVDNTSSGKGKDEDPSLQALREAVVRFTKEKLVLETPLSWILFRKVVQVLNEKYKYNVISLRYARIIGAASNISREDVPHVLMFYHELGVLLFYPQIDGLKDKIILNPKYIVDALGEMFRLRENSDGGRHHKEWKLFHEFGILVQPLYVELWKNYDNISPEIVIKVLVHFRIAVAVKTDKYSPPSEQYFMPFILKPTQVSRSSTLPLDSIQAAPLHITFNSGYVPPGFFTRFVVVLANAKRMELCFEKDVYRNRITFRYQDPNCNSIQHVIVTDCHDVIQINVQHYPSDQEVASFTKICQDIRFLLEDAAKKVKKILKKCACGLTVDNKETQYIFTGHKFEYVCTSCPLTTSPHYIKLPQFQNQDSQVFCQKNTNDYRVLTELEKVWFKDTSQVKSIFSLFFKGTSQSTPATQTSPTATAKSPKFCRRRKDAVFISSDMSDCHSDVKLLDISDLDDHDYRVLTEREKVWFKDTSQSTPATQMSPTSTAKPPKENDSKRRTKEKVLTSSDESHAKLLDISDLDDVIDELRSINSTEWKQLGLSLGLSYNTLETIEEKCRGNPRKCLLECMAAWLKGEDKVREKGGPSWSSLATALEKIGENDIAINIKAKCLYRP